MVGTASYSHSTNNIQTKTMEEIVDDVMEEVRKGFEQELTEHLNSIDTTDDNSMPFLDTLKIRKEDGTVKLLVSRKKTHTDQYLKFTSHHSLHQKLEVIKTLLDRYNNTVIAIKRWNTLQGTRKMWIPKLDHKEGERTANLKGKNHQNIRRILEHPKDKVEDGKKTDCVYQIPCKSCNQMYIGKIGKTFRTRLEEHKKEVENIITRCFRRESAVVEHKSAITDHEDGNNCITDWEGAKVID